MRCCLDRRALSRTVTGLQSEAPVLASVLPVASPAAVRATLLVASQALFRVHYPAHRYRAAPGCVFSLGHPYILPNPFALLSLTLKHRPYKPWSSIIAADVELGVGLGLGW